jgi:signal transduction histidine kinase
VGFLGLPLLPGAYFYVAYQGQLGGLVIRSNQLLGKDLFILLILILYIGLATIAAARVAVTGHLFFVGLIAALISIVVAVTGYAPFQRFVEQYLLRMPLPTQQLAEVFATRIAANLELHGLITLWQDELLPSLLVRESAMLQLRDNQQITIIAQVGIRNDQTPNHTELPLLLEKATASKRLKPGQVGERLVWVRMILPLRIGKEVSGFWLFGARDPNDHYSRAELSSFQALADQMAIALLNIEQATLLRTLYTTNVDRHELERQRLAHELHDDLLNDIATLALLIPDTDAALEVERSFQALIQKIRHLITGLRPAMLTYGLYAALEELTDDLSDRFGVSLAVRFDIAPSEARFPIRVEQQLFRIIQQACENALRHARTEDLYVYGAIQTNRVSVTVSDHGVGFDLGQDIDWAQLQQDKHFGLIGMYERAKLIGADLQIQSQPGQGTTVSVQWASQDGVEYD